MTDLDAAIARIAGAPKLLVASDFDGTLSPIVDDPGSAAPLDSAVAALTALADLPDTHVAVVSGRALADLRTHARVPAHIHLIGGHGIEIDSLPDSGLSPGQQSTRTQILDALTQIARSAEGFVVEQKPASVAFHYRNAPAAAADPAVRAVRRLAERTAGVSVMEGKKVIELAVAEGDKGRALRRLADSLAVDATLYVGDDVTDEDAFAALGPDDLGVKVGVGDTAARCRIGEPADVAVMLRRLLERRGRGRG